MVKIRYCIQKCTEKWCGSRERPPPPVINPVQIFTHDFEIPREIPKHQNPSRNLNISSEIPKSLCRKSRRKTTGDPFWKSRNLKQNPEILNENLEKSRNSSRILEIPYEIPKSSRNHEIPREISKSLAKSRNPCNILKSCEIPKSWRPTLFKCDKLLDFGNENRYRHKLWEMACKM